MYAAGDVTVNGSATTDNENKTTTWKNATVKKGWNILYVCKRENAGKTSEEITSTAPEGIKWYAGID
jgi:hypothetical protein